LPALSACSRVICIWPSSAAVVHSLLWPIAFASFAHVRPFLRRAITIISVTSLRLIGLA
jgi:hypothetical protein